MPRFELNFSSIDFFENFVPLNATNPSIATSLPLEPGHVLVYTKSTLAEQSTGAAEQLNDTIPGMEEKYFSEIVPKASWSCSCKGIYDV